MSGEQVLLSLLMFQVTGSSVWVGVTLALYFSPSFFVGALAGAIADWMDRRELLRRCELALTVLLGAFAGLLMLGLMNPVAILAFAIVSGSLRALFDPAQLSYAYDLVGASRSVGGLSMLNVGARSGHLIGALVTGYLAHHFGVGHAYAAVAVAHGLGFLLLVRLQSAGIASEPDHAPLAENLRTIVREMRSNRDLLAVTSVMIVVGILGFSYLTVLPELATTELGAGAQELGFMHAAKAAGGLAGVAVLTALGISRHRGLLLMVTVLGFGCGLCLLGSAGTLGLVMAALLLTAAAAAVYDVLTQSVMQIIVPNRLRGRAMGMWVLVIGIEPVGFVLVGAVVAWLGVGLVLQINGGILILVSLLALSLAPRLRRI